MRIVSQGSGKDKWTKQFTCQECKAVLEVEENDLKGANMGANYGGDPSEYKIVFACAACHSINKVTDRVPSGIRSRLLEEAKTRDHQAW